MEGDVLVQRPLSNGMTLYITDVSHQHTGDLYRLWLDVWGQHADYGVLQQPRKLQRLEALAVPAQELEQRRQQMLEQYLLHNLKYLEHPQFPQRWQQQQEAG